MIEEITMHHALRLDLFAIQHYHAIRSCPMKCGCKTFVGTFTVNADARVDQRLRNADIRQIFIMKTCDRQQTLKPGGGVKHMLYM